MDQAGGYARHGISGHAGYRRTAPSKGKKYIAPEDRELIIHEMRIDRVPEELDRAGEHSFYCESWICILFGFLISFLYPHLQRISYGRAAERCRRQRA